MTLSERLQLDELPERRRWWILWTVMIGALISSLDSSIINVAIPAMIDEYQVGVQKIQWVVSAYMIAFATLMPLTSWLQEKIGEKRLYISSLAVFTLGSVFCGFAWNVESLIVARIIQALGGGAMVPIAMSVISKVFPREQKGRALGYWGMAVVMGPAFGPTIGGMLTQSMGWRSVFWVNIPIGIIGIYMASEILRKDIAHVAVSWKSFDFRGFLLFTLFLVSLLYGVTEVEFSGFGSQVVIFCWMLSLLSIVSFIIIESSSKKRLFDFKLIQNRAFGFSVMITMMRSFALYGGTFLLPLYCIRVLGYEETKIGLMILPGSLLIGFLMPPSGKGSDRLGARPFVIAGLSLILIFFLSMSFLHSRDIGFWDVEIPILIRGVGLGLLVTPITAFALNSIPTAKSAHGSMILGLAQQVGGSLGIAILGSLIDIRMKVYGTLYHEQDALTRCFEDAFRVGAFLTLISFLFAIGLKDQKSEPHEAKI